MHPDRFKVVLARVAEDATKRGLTREINKEEDIRRYAEKVGKELPKTKMKGAFNPDDLFAPFPPTSSEDGEESEKKKRSSKGPKLTPSVIPRGFVCSSKHERVRQIFNELRSMKIVKHRNSSGVMLRVLLEIALWEFLKETSKNTEVCDHYDADRKYRNKNPNWTPPLKDLINYCVKERLFPNMTQDGYKSASTLAAKDPTYFITMEGFNAFVHNPNVIPTEGDLRALWQRAEPMFEIILARREETLGGVG